MLIESHTFYTIFVRLNTKNLILDHNMKGYMLKFDNTWTRVLYLFRRVHTYNALPIETF
jgi:hypothetical protein